jgi:hypothetical protein
MDTGIQQFLKSNTNHLFPLLESASADHPAEHGIVTDVIVAATTHQ